MEISSVSNAGLTAIQRGLDKVEKAADSIAKLPMSSEEVGASESKSVDMVQALVSAKEADLETQAGAKVVGVYDEMIGAILDVSA